MNMIDGCKKYTPSFLFFLLLPLFFFACSETAEETLKRVAKETNKKCPQVVDQYTTMLSCEALPGRTMKFTYRAAKEVDMVPGEAEVNEMKKILIETLKQRKEVGFYSTNDVRFEHLFLNAQNQPIMHIEIEAQDYK